VNWIDNVVRPKIRTLFASSSQTPENLWIKCPETGEMVFHRDLENNDWVVPNSGHHMRMPVRKRLERLFDESQFELIATPDVVADPLKFRDERKYADRIRDARPASRLALLTPRELQILRMIGRGMPRNDIARIIHRSPKTVDAHRASIMDKLGLHDRVDLARFAIREGLVEA
jgi:DNA-binding CsgD family transcriptional regulator